jgi:hypothetical protein
VLGSFSLTGGSGDDLAFFDGVLAGNLTFTMGNGDDLAFFGADPVAGGFTALGTAITLIGGNGDDGMFVLDVSGPVLAVGARLTFLGQNGNDTVDWAGSTVLPIFASAYLDGGFGLNDYIPNANPVDYPITIRNFV